MPSGVSPSRRLATAARWPAGVALTSWRYLWRTTPLARAERRGTPQEDGAPALPAGVSRHGVQGEEDGVGPLFHRIYRVRVAGPQLSARELAARVQADPDCAAPGEFAAFVKVAGDAGVLRVGDEFVVRMAGPWDGPVRVIAVTPTSYRLATLAGHLEAGQIEFAAADEDGALTFRIESWARSGDRLSFLLYRHLRMAKEVQMHMWTSYLERVVALAGGRRDGRLSIDTRRVDDGGGRGR